MDSRKKKGLYAGFILLTLAVIVIIGANSGDFEDSLRALFDIPRRWVLAGVLCVFTGILMQALSAKSVLRIMGHRLSLGRACSVSILGEFYSFITPGASGGQPMQINRLRRYGIPVGDAASAMVVHYLCYHIMILALDVVLGLTHLPFVRRQIGVNWPFLLIGFLFNGMLVTFAVLLSFYQRPVRWLLDKLMALMARLKLGQPDRLRQKVGEAADTFYTGMRFMLEHKLEVARQMLFGALRIASMAGVIFCVYRGLGLREASFGRLMTMGVMQYTSAGYTPLPGASGAQEGIFSVYFDQLFPEELLFSGLLAWRFISYYLVLIVGFIVITAMGMGGKKKRTGVR